MSAAKLLTLTMVLVVLGACATSPPTDYPKSPSAALQNTQDSTLGKKVSALITGHPADESGFYMLRDGVDVLAARLLLANRAERSIDAQYR